jgi:hypothetical protein
VRERLNGRAHPPSLQAASVDIVRLGRHLFRSMRTNVDQGGLVDVS